ncbi:hypothetical protein ACSSS7_002178 [Eimeria intestinalis]
MEATILWQQRLARGEDAGSFAWSVAFSPDGAQLVLGVGCCVLVADAASGATLHTLAEHKGEINAVAFAADGKRFASGGSDKQVILWAASGELLRRFTHSGSVQALAFNPRTHVLASGAAEELGFWSEENHKETHAVMFGGLRSSSSLLRSKVLSNLLSSRNSRGAPGGSSSDANAHASEAGGGEGGPSRSTSQLSSISTSEARSHKALVPTGKIRVSSKVCGIAWNEDGRLLVSGHLSGLLVVRDEEGNKLCKHQFKAAVWTVAWRPRPPHQREAEAESKDEGDEDIVLACTFEPKLWLVAGNGKSIISSTTLSAEPLHVAFAPGGDYFLMSAVGEAVSLWSREGKPLHAIYSLDAKVETTACCFHPSGKRLAFVNRHGQLGLAQLKLPVVHGLHRELYARRTGLREVTLRNLITDGAAVLRFDELVHKVAVYRQLLAVQLSQCIVILHSLSPSSQKSFEYKETHRLSGSFDCALMLLIAQAVLLCKGASLELRSFTGSVQKGWTLRASIRYIRVVGGPPGEEVLLMGLRSGEALYLYVHQELPVPLLQHSAGLICVDISAKRDKLVVVDEAKELCSLAPYQQSCRGIVVGFAGPHAFCLYLQEMRRVVVNHMVGVHQHMKRGSIMEAYSLACIGVVREDWKELGFECLLRGDLRFARKCFQHHKDCKLLCMLNHIEDELPTLRLPSDLQTHVCRAYAFACLRDFEAAADEWAKAGLPQRAHEMFVELRRWAEAQKWAAVAAEAAKVEGPTEAKAAEASDLSEQAKNENMKKSSETSAVDVSAAAINTQRQGEASKEVAVEHELREAAALYLAAGQVERACSIFARIGEVHGLLEIVRKLQKVASKPSSKDSEADDKQQGQCALPVERRDPPIPHSSEIAAALRLASHAFEQTGHLSFAQEALVALGDLRLHVRLLTRAGRWDEALARAEQDPRVLKQQLVVWGHELLRRDQPASAICAFRRASREDLALRVEAALLQSAVSQRLFAQASARSFALSSAFLRMCVRQSRPCGCESAASGDPAFAGDPVEAQTELVSNCSRPHALPHNLPSSVRLYLVLYFRRLAELYGVYFVVQRQIGPVPPRADMTPHAVLRACAFLWSHALAPLAQPIKLSPTSLDASEASAAATSEAARPRFDTLRSGSVAAPCWRLLPWWKAAKAALQRPEIQTCLRLCGLSVRRRPKGLRAAPVLQLMGEIALKLHDFRMALCAVGELRLLALRGFQLRARDTLGIKVKVARAAASVGRGPKEKPTDFSWAPCGLCGAPVPLLTSLAVPLGADISCPKCGCPLVIEFGSFAPVAAVEVCPDEVAPTSKGLPGAACIEKEEENAKEIFLDAVQRQVRVQPPPSSAQQPPGPIEFEPPKLSLSLLRRQPREAVLSLPQAGIEGSSQSRTLRLLGLPHAEAERAAAAEGAAAGPGTADMLTACSKCHHLFVDPPAHAQLLPQNPCICCESTAPRTPILSFATLK